MGEATDDLQPRGRGRFSTQSELDDRALVDAAATAGASFVSECRSGFVTTLTGRLRSVTIRPQSGAPALETELWDGTGSLQVVFLGRRRIPGIAPGRVLTVHGRPVLHNGERTMFNPRYELAPARAE